MQFSVAIPWRERAKLQLVTVFNEGETFFFVYICQITLFLEVISREFNYSFFNYILKKEYRFPLGTPPQDHLANIDENHGATCLPVLHLVGSMYK